MTSTRPSDYLTKNYGPEAPKPVNVNKATPVEIESTLALTRAESAAIVQYRADKGDFKGLDDLKNVPGLDFKKSKPKRPGLPFKNGRFEGGHRYVPERRGARVPCCQFGKARQVSHQVVRASRGP